MNDLWLDGAAATATASSTRADGNAQIADAGVFRLAGASPAVDVATTQTAWQADLRLTGEAIVAAADGIDASIETFRLADRGLGVAARGHAARAV